MKSKFIIISFLMLCLLSLVSLCPAQNIVNAGDKILKYKGPLGERRYIQYIENQKGHVSFNTLLTRKIELAGGDKYLITQTYQSAKNVDVDSSYCTSASMAPISYTSVVKSEGHREQVIFQTDTILNTTFFGDSSQTTAKSNTGYFNAVVTDELIAGLPLKEGASFELNTVNPGLRFHPTVTKITVERKETLELAGKKFLCWRIRVGHEGFPDSTEWFTVEGRIQLLKKFPIGNGSTFYRTLIFT
jgi:hypothetical protein